MVPNHATQTDPYLHEPKGISTATAGQVYVATGAGTGTWQAQATNAAFLNTATTGLFYTVAGGYLRSGSSISTIATATLTLTDASTNYVYVDINALTIGSNTTGFLPHHIPLYTVTTVGGSVTSNVDNRPSAVNAQPQSYAALTFASDANKTLSNFEYSNAVIKLTGTISTGRNVVVPVTLQPTHFINGTAQTITIIGATGTGIGIATTKTAKVCGDGTNIVRLTADV